MNGFKLHKFELLGWARIFFDVIFGLGHVVIWDCYGYVLSVVSSRRQKHDVELL